MKIIKKQNNTIINKSHNNSIEALNKLQKELEGEAQAIGFESEEEVMGYVYRLRHEIE